METNTPPRCPSCGGVMTVTVRGPYIEQWVCLRHDPAIYGDPVRVPCPACAGTGEAGRVTDDVDCTLCRGSGNVPPDLAAAWVAAGQRSDGGEG